MEYTFDSRKHRLTQKQKDANDKQWYKDQADLYDGRNNGMYSTGYNYTGHSGVSEFKRKKLNYDLFNNIIDMRDFTYVCQPFGAEVGDLPANMTNRDIVSTKIKVLLGMEMNMPFSWKVYAVNEEATTRREQEEFGRIKDYVVSEVMRPIREELEAQAAEQTKGKQLSPEEVKQIKQQVAQQTQAQTPDEVRRYMKRQHQDPAEVQGNQILNYLIEKENIRDKFNKGMKHLCLAGQEIYLVTIINGEPKCIPVNPLYFDYDMSPDLDTIQEGEWAKCEYRMTPSTVVSLFGSELTDEQIDKVYEYHNNPASVADATFSFNTDRAHEPYTVRCLHLAFKSLRKVGFLYYKSPITGDVEMKIVDENYRLSKVLGDIRVEWEWIPECHEVWKILDDIYVYARPVPGQHRDPDNLWKCDLPYYGAAVDYLNSPITAPMDRIKSYQYFYDVIVYRIELLMASDKGKAIAVNIKGIPKSAGINLQQWMYFFEANKIAFLNPNEEGMKGSGDVTNMIKDVDMSMVSKINEYIGLAEYIERKCGAAIGVTPQMEAQIAEREAVSNTRQNLMQASFIVKPYFELHNSVKGAVLTALLEKAKIAYSQGKPRKLSYIMDDMSVMMFEVDQNMLDASTLGLFIANAGKADDAKKAVETLSQSAMQNQQVDLLDVIRIVRSESVTEAEEMLEVSRDRMQEQQQAIEQQKIEAAQKLQDDQHNFKREEWEHELALVREKGKFDLQKQAMLSIGFNEDKDLDDDGQIDVLEVYKAGKDADIKERQTAVAEARQALDEQKFTHQQKVDKEKLEIDRKKASKPTSSVKK